MDRDYLFPFCLLQNNIINSSCLITYAQIIQIFKFRLAQYKEQIPVSDNPPAIQCPLSPACSPPLATRPLDGMPFSTDCVWGALYHSFYAGPTGKTSIPWSSQSKGPLPWIGPSLSRYLLMWKTAPIATNHAMTKQPEKKKGRWQLVSHALGLAKPQAGFKGKGSNCMTPP